METWDAITSRRNVRSFEDRAIPDADLDRIREAGRRTPSSRNWQPWDFVVVTDREQLRRLAGVWQFGAHIADAAAAIALIVPAGLDGRERDAAEHHLAPATTQLVTLPPTSGSAPAPPGSASRTWRARCSSYRKTERPRT